MEQHYVIIYGIIGESIGQQYVMCCIIDKYPGTPHDLLQVIIQTIENNSIEKIGKFQKKELIAIKSLTRTL